MTNKQLHVLYLPSWYPSKDMPLNGIFFKEQAEAVAKNNVKVGILYLEFDSLKRFGLKKIKENHFQTSDNLENGMMVIRKHAWNVIPHAYKIQLWYLTKQYLKMFKKYINEYGIPDIIHVHSVLWGGYVAQIISEKYNIPYIITEHSTGIVLDQYKDYQIKYIKDAYKNASYLIAVSSALAKSMKKYVTGNEIGVLPNFIDTSYFVSVDNNEEKKGTFSFLTVAFLSKRKGIDILIKAFYKAFYNKNVMLKVGGSGEEESNLKKLVNDLNLNKQVSFLGLLNRDKVLNEMKKSNVFVSASSCETFGVVLIEAMSTGIPVISTKSGGPEDIINDEVGLLCENGDVDSLSKAMEKIYNNYDNYNLNKIKQYAINNYSSEAITKKLIAIYNNILYRGSIDE